MESMLRPKQQNLYVHRACQEEKSISMSYVGRDQSHTEHSSFDLFFPIGAKLMEYMRETKIHQFPKKPQQKSPFEFAHGCAMFEYMGENQDQRDYLDDYMAIRRQGLVNWHETFPMAAELGPEARKDNESVLLVDIGGGWGHDLQSFHKAHPDVPGRLILQDLPIIIERVQREGRPEGVECMIHDFFKTQPIRGQSLAPSRYYSTDILQGHEYTTSTTSATTGRTVKQFRFSPTRRDQWRKGTQGS
jgi:hypothetical protein